MGILAPVRKTILNFIKRPQFRAWLQGWGYDITPFPATDVSALNSHLSTLLNLHKINCVLDVGANQGQFAAMIRNGGYAGRIVSFEPISSNFKILQHRFGDDIDWRGYQCALGAVEAELDIQVTKHSVFSSFLAPSKYSETQFGDDSRVIDRELVPIKRLDDLLPDLVEGLNDPRVFLKTDTQGYDLRVIEGASNTIEMLSGIQMELSLLPIYEGAPNYLESLGVLAAAGFEITGLFAVNRDSSLRAIELDCVCVRRDHFRSSTS